MLTPNLPTNIVDFRGFDSSTILMLRDGILISIGEFPESLSRAMLVGVIREIGRIPNFTVIVPVIANFIVIPCKIAQHRSSPSSLEKCSTLNSDHNNLLHVWEV